MLLFFLLTGRWLDSVMRDRARDGVSALLKHKAAGALVLAEDGTSGWVSADALKTGMVMLVAAGERLAADGIVIKGRSQFDLSLLTGESVPVLVAVGDMVHAGTLNVDAPVEVRITATGAATALADIARLMEDAGQSKSRYVRIADRAARYYAPAVHTLALLSFAGWMLAGAGWHQSLLIAVAVLIITCPCALGLAVPAAQIVTAGALMKKGILVKDGSALERLAEVDRALFDKTGTLTLGRPNW
jgi:Cu2+-exporting ATPase